MNVSLIKLESDIAARKLANLPTMRRVQRLLGLAAAVPLAACAKLGNPGCNVSAFTHPIRGMPANSTHAMPDQPPGIAV